MREWERERERERVGGKRNGGGVKRGLEVVEQSANGHISWPQRSLLAFRFDFVLFPSLPLLALPFPFLSHSTC